MEIEAKKGEKIEIPDGAVLENKVSVSSCVSPSASKYRPMRFLFLPRVSAPDLSSLCLSLSEQFSC